MLFNSLKFAVFIVIVYGLYLKLDHKRQNRMLLAASYVFYGAWDWRFLSLIFFSTVLDYFCGLKIHESPDPKRKKRFLLLSIIANLSILGIFKYFNFFTFNLQRLLETFGVTIPPVFLNIILPLGISFYTFQTMSYTIDIHRREIEPTRNFCDFALFVTFFPQLVAGPIERAKRLLPQIILPRQVTLDKFYEGCFLIFWGLVMKICIADNLGDIVNPVYRGAPPYNGVDVLLASYAFTFQIFCDFAGYSNMARGLGKIMGFDIMINFNLPFFVTNVQDFWNRWHISLSSWLRDYVYFPLFRGLRNVKGNLRIYASLMITLVLIGFWHGAAWTFGIFGFYYGVLLCLYIVIRTRCHSWIKPESPWGERLWVFARMVFMFHLVVIGNLIFRAEYASQIYFMLKAVFFNFTIPPGAGKVVFTILFYTWILIAVQLAQFWKKDLMAVFRSPAWVRAVFYYACFMFIIFYGDYGSDEFIYFQF